MRLGTVRFYEKYNSPEEWVRLAQKHQYRAVAAPVDETASDDVVAAYRRAAEANDLVIAEVGVWRNTCSNDETTRRKNIATAKARLHLADKLGARCAVNITGERTRRAGADDLTDEAFERVVATAREIVDDVNPLRTYYCLETMPYMLPDSVEVYVKLLRAIDRDRVAAHCDPVNFVTSPRLYHNNGAMIREFFRQLGPQIRSCHAKDILLSAELTVHLSECMPGKGGLDYRTFLAEINRLDPELPLLMEHLNSDAEYDEAAQFIRRVQQALPA
jgi:sugar phosphate isomerase/epimerase